MGHKTRTAAFSLAIVLASFPALAAEEAGSAEGKFIYENNCISCHRLGLVGSPRVGDEAAWTPLVKKGMVVLYNSAINGVGTMPPKGAKLGLTDEEVKIAVDNMVNESRHASKGAAKSIMKKPAGAPGSEKEAGAPEAPVAPALGQVQGAAVTSSKGTIPFNRLLQKWKPNLSPPEDGIHDPSNKGTHMLQPPEAGFQDFIRTYKAGNYVDWVQTIEKGIIKPRSDRLDPTAEQLVFDLNVRRVPRGSMPNVIYPHKQHTEWLDCSNCHPAIFIPQRGANQISMGAILLGQKCGVCHGKVSFPVSQCTKCHSEPKKDNVLPRSESIKQ